MVREGTTVFEQLDRARHQARQDVERDRAEAGQVEGQVRELVASRGAALLALAKHYLPEISRPNVEQTFEGVQAELMAIVAKKEGRRRELTDAQEAARGESSRQEAELEDVTRRLNELVARREKLEAQVAATLGADPEFARLSKAAAQAEELLHRNEQRVAEIQSEAAAKRPAFESSRLFRYLYNRGYGTPAYAAEGIIRRLDAWVARLIDFPRARKGYEFLMRTPELVADEVARRKEAFDALMQQVEALERRESDAAGLTALLEEGNQLGSQRDGLVARLAETRQGIARIEAELAELDTERSAFYREAIDRFRAFLERTESGVLERRARSSPEPQDDALVGQITQTGRSIADLNARLADLARQRQATESIHAGLDRLVTQFRQANYDSERSYFEDMPDLDGLLDRYRRGEVREDALWNVIQGAQRFRPLRVEPSPEFGRTWGTTGAGGASGGLPEIVFSPAGRVIIGAMGQVLDAALRQNAWRGVQRRGESWSPPMEMPTPSAPPPAPSQPSGGFTSGEGF